MANYAVSDFAGITAAFVLLGVLCVCPGFVTGWLLNLWSFRSRSLTFQLVASISLSIGIGPLFSFLTTTYSWIGYVAALAASLWLLGRSRIHFSSTLRKAGLLAVCWFVFAAVWLMDWQFGSRVYFPIYAWDYSTRAAIVHSLATFGLPAQTPFLNPGHFVPLHYHFLWLYECALIHKLAPHFMTGRLAFFAGAIWAGLGLACVTALAMKIIMRRNSWVAVGLLAATGLDLIPALVFVVANSLHLIHVLPPSVEWWNDQVDGWLYSVLWEPHYICSLIACVTGFLLLYQSQSIANTLVAAVCFASATGSGSFVALVFACFLLLWALLNWRESKHIFVAGLLAAALSLPYLLTLRGPAQNVAGPSLLQFRVRMFSPVLMPVPVRLATLPLNYFLELGFFAVCVFVGYRRKLARHETMLLLMAGASILICTFIKSGATPNNDLGWRGFLVAQFALLILAAEYMERVALSSFLRVLLFIGFAGTGYDLFMTRFFPILSDHNWVPRLNWFADGKEFGTRTKDNRAAYAWLIQHSAETATIAQNPAVESVDIFSGLYADRRIVAGDRTCTIGFGGSAAECASVWHPLTAAYRGELDLGQACRSVPAQFYFVKDSDPIWTKPSSWAWLNTPVFSNESVRIFRCSGSNSIRK